MCRAELCVTPAILAERFAMVAEADGCLRGYVEVSIKDGDCHLEKLFVAPEAMGCGIGAQLLGIAIDYAKQQHAREMVIEADPDAVPFYHRFGAIHAGHTKSGSVPGRTLPRLLLRL